MSLRARPWVYTVPAILAAGFLSGWASNSGYGNAWFDALAKPAFMPPGWAFPVVWTTLYVLMGVALADLIEAGARAARVRRLFLAQLVLNLAWSPLFFALHRIADALALIVALDVIVAVTILAAWRVSRRAASLLVPYLAWLALATALNLEILRLNG